MRSFGIGYSLITFVLALQAGCGGKVVFDGEQDGPSGSSSESSSQTSGTFPDGVLTPVVDELQFSANCMPNVPPDPVSGSVTVSYINKSGVEAGLSLGGASLGFASGVEAWLFFMDLTPTSSGLVPANSEVTVVHEKTTMQQDSSFICSLCNLPMTVQLTFFSEQGTQIIVTEESKLNCSR
jgi:hypothetical protein